MLRHVASIALSYRNYNVPVADLVAEGNFGVVHALRKYDPDRGIRFVTYATYWVRAYILNHVISTWSLVGVGTGPLRSKMFFRLRREHARIEELAEAGAEGERQLAEDFGAPAGRVLAMARRLEARDVSLDVRTHDDGATRGEELADEGEDQEHRLGEAEERAALRARLAPVVGRLRPRERRIVEARLMADPEDVRSLADIGRELGVSRERARQLEARAKRRIREHLAADPRES
jgi:RNA polymerase sigma-32 factor